jgi:hypothetical protein
VKIRLGKILVTVPFEKGEKNPPIESWDIPKLVVWKHQSFGK